MLKIHVSCLRKYLISRIIAIKTANLDLADWLLHKNDVINNFFIDQKINFSSHSSFPANKCFLVATKLLKQNYLKVGKILILNINDSKFSSTTRSDFRVYLLIGFATVSKNVMK